jgi:hypothetical protein
MGFVLLANDAYAFMVAWECMAISSYFLVTTQHRIPEARRALHATARDHYGTGRCAGVPGLGQSMPRLVAESPRAEHLASLLEHPQVVS